MTDLLRFIKLGGGDTFTDRLSSRYTFGLLTLIALLGSVKLYFGEAISCWTPAHFVGAHTDYTNQNCLSAATYYLPNDQYFFDSEGETNEILPPKYLSLHNWIPLVFLFQAFLFYLPRRFWKQMGRKCGLSVSGVVDGCLQTEKTPPEDVVERVDRFLTEASEEGSANVYLLVIYLVTKLMYLTNLILQIGLMNFFLKRLTYMYGLQNLIKLIAKTSWQTSKLFPRIILCQFSIRHNNRNHDYIVQCGMPINTFYEVVVTFLWLWLLYVVVCSFCSFFSWLLTSFIPSYQRRWVRRRIGNEEGVNEFVKTRLGHDGCFLLRMVASNCNDVVASQLLSRLWQRHTQQRQATKHIRTDMSPKESAYPNIH